MKDTDIVVVPEIVYEEGVTKSRTPYEAKKWRTARETWRQTKNWQDRFPITWVWLQIFDQDPVTIPAEVMLEAPEGIPFFDSDMGHERFVFQLQREALDKWSDAFRKERPKLFQFLALFLPPKASAPKEAFANTGSTAMVQMKKPPRMEKVATAIASAMANSKQVPPKMTRLERVAAGMENDPYKTTKWHAGYRKDIVCKMDENGKVTEHGSIEGNPITYLAVGPDFPGIVTLKKIKRMDELMFGLEPIIDDMSGDDL